MPYHSIWREQENAQRKYKTKTKNTVAPAPTHAVYAVGAATTLGTSAATTPQYSSTWNSLETESCTPPGPGPWPWP